VGPNDLSDWCTVYQGLQTNTVSRKFSSLEPQCTFIGVSVNNDFDNDCDCFVLFVTVVFLKLLLASRYVAIIVCGLYKMIQAFCFLWQKNASAMHQMHISLDETQQLGRKARNLQGTSHQPMCPISNQRHTAPWKIAVCYCALPWTVVSRRPAWVRSVNFGFAFLIDAFEKITSSLIFGHI
jgi:hypothetical protein